VTSEAIPGAAAPAVAASLDPDAAFERVDLGGGSWVDLARGWVRGADALYDHLTASVAWQANRLWRYERWVDEPRVGTWFGSPAAYPHPVFAQMQRALQHRYRVQFDGFALAWYRDGADSVAFHRDRDLRYCEDTVIAIVTFGARRPWLLRPRARGDKWIAEHGGATHDLAPASGDLLVCGGRCQADWEHAVPKVRGAGAAAGRISAQFRWTSRTGRPEVGASYRAPRHFTRG
jgi:alkylated DNA repair dioxygenase AlkB